MVDFIDSTEQRVKRFQQPQLEPAAAAPSPAPAPPGPNVADIPAGQFQGSDAYSDDTLRGIDLEFGATPAKAPPKFGATDTEKVEQGALSPEELARLQDTNAQAADVQAQAAIENEKANLRVQAKQVANAEQQLAQNQERRTAELERQQDLKTAQERVTQASDALSALKPITRGRVLTDNSPVGTALASLTVIFGGLRAANNPEAGAAIIDKLFQTDLEDQQRQHEAAKGSLEQAQNAYSQLVNHFGNEREAELAYKAILADDLEQELKKELATTTDEQRRLAIENILAQTELQKGKAGAELAKEYGDQRVIQQSRQQVVKRPEDIKTPGEQIAETRPAAAPQKRTALDTFRAYNQLKKEDPNLPESELVRHAQAGTTPQQEASQREETQLAQDQGEAVAQEDAAIQQELKSRQDLANRSGQTEKAGAFQRLREGKSAEAAQPAQEQKAATGAFGKLVESKGSPTEVAGTVQKGSGKFGTIPKEPPTADGFFQLARRNPTINKRVRQLVAAGKKPEEALSQTYYDLYGKSPGTLTPEQREKAVQYRNPATGNIDYLDFGSSDADKEAAAALKSYDSLQEAVTGLKELGGYTASPSKRAQARSYMQDIVGAMRLEKFGPGAFTDTEQENAREAYTSEDATSLFSWLAEKGTAVLEKVERGIQEGRRRTLKNATELTTGKPYVKQVPRATPRD